MVRYYRRRFYRRYRPRRYVRRWFRRRFRRYINGSSRSSCRLKVPVHDVDSFTQVAGQVGTSTVNICPFASSAFRTSPLNSQLYRTYCSLYDEVKCVGFKINVNVSSAVGGSEIPSLQIYTAFDRKFCHGENGPSYADMKTYSTYQVATAVNNSVAKLQRSIYASDILEKATWHDCSLSLAGGTYSDSAYVAAGANCNFFSPAFFLCFAVPQQTLQATINVTYDITYYFAFRNPKYGGTASSSKLDVEVLDRVAPVAGGGDDGDDEDDMDDAPAPSIDVEDRAVSQSNLPNLARQMRSRARIVDATRRQKN